MSGYVKQKTREAAEAVRKTGKAAKKDAAAAAQETVRAVGDAAGEAAETIRTRAKETLRDAGAATASAAQSIRDGADSARRAAADQGDKVASALHDRAEDQGTGSMQSKVLESVAGGMENLSTRVREGNLNQILADAENFARRNPLLFIAGAALAGFAIARLTQSRGDPDEAP